MARIPGTFDFSANLEVNKQGPLDARLTVESQSELTGLPFAYIGMIVSVTSDSTPANNGIYILEDTDGTNLSNWTLIGTGEKGEKGEIGEKGSPGADSNVAGPKGDKGDTGEKGSPGADSNVAGPKGDKGEAGADSNVAGPKGDKGEAGADSSVAGPKGDKGEIGDKGSPGADSNVAGPKGDKGDPGADSNVAGPKGDKGDQGDKGDPGADSTVPGPKGDKGDQGDKGSPGADSNVAGPKGDKGEAGADSNVAGPKGDKGDTGEGVIAGGTTGQVLAKATNTNYDTEWIDASSGGGATKYLLRLEYDINEALISGQGSFVTTGGFSSGGSIDSYTVGSGSAGHFVTLSFANETTPPVAIFAYAWQPATGAYKVTHYDNDDTAQIVYNTAIVDFAHQSTNEGGSGISGQWAANTTSLFTGDFSSYGMTLPVEQSVLKYANGVPGGFGSPDKLPHVYITFIF